MKLTDFSELKASLGTQNAKLGVKEGSKLYKEIINNIKKAVNCTKTEAKECYKEYMKSYKEHQISSYKKDIKELKTIDKKFKDWTIMNTDVQIKPIISEANNKYIESIINSENSKEKWNFTDNPLYIRYSEPKKIKKRTSKKFNHMLNQVTLKIDVDSDKEKIVQVTVMCFFNLSLTLTGCKDVKYGQTAVDAILNVFDCFELVKEPVVVMTTYHYPLKVKCLDLATLSQYLIDNVKVAKINYNPDIISFLRITYDKDRSTCKIIVRESGKIMFSGGKVSTEFMKSVYENIIGLIVKHINNKKLN